MKNEPAGLNVSAIYREVSEHLLAFSISFAARLTGLKASLEIHDAFKESPEAHLCSQGTGRGVPHPSHSTAHSAAFTLVLQVQITALYLLPAPCFAVCCELGELNQHLLLSHIPDTDSACRAPAEQG